MSTNLIDMIEIFANQNALEFSRIDDSEIAIELNYNNEYGLSVMLRPNYDIAYFACDLNIIVPEGKNASIIDAIVKANERIWIGHFDFISSDERIIYSLTIPFISAFMIDEEILESTIRMISDECDRFYHYFLMIINNRNSKELSDFSISTLFLEAAGEA